MRVPWAARRSNQSILKETSPGCLLEGLMLTLKLQYFGHLKRRASAATAAKSLPSCLTLCETLQWKLGVHTNGPPGKSLYGFSRPDPPSFPKASPPSASKLSPHLMMFLCYCLCFVRWFILGTNLTRLRDASKGGKILFLGMSVRCFWKRLVSELGD